MRALSWRQTDQAPVVSKQYQDWQKRDKENQAEEKVSTCFTYFFFTKKEVCFCFVERVRHATLQATLGYELIDYTAC